MNFFALQDEARRTSRRLIWLFPLTVLAVVLAVNGLALLIAWLVLHHGLGVSHWQDHLPRFYTETNTAITLLMVLGGAWVETQALSSGGAALARRLGAQPVMAGSLRSGERRVLNIVEEMAIASGLPVPALYLLDREPGINALTAGHGAGDAVVILTQGAVEQLDREQLQAVVAHEFSHILHGDARLNIRLAGLVHGLLLLRMFGRQLLDWGWPDRAWALVLPDPVRRAARREGLNLLLVAAGMVLSTVGVIGWMAARLLQAGVSRQREFLADATAVQLTRQTRGLVGALNRIGAQGGRLGHAASDEVAHLCLAAVGGRWSERWFATHPSIEARIRRLRGQASSALQAARSRRQPQGASGMAAPAQGVAAGVSEGMSFAAPQADVAASADRRMTAPDIDSQDLAPLPWTGSPAMEAQAEHPASHAPESACPAESLDDPGFARWRVLGLLWSADPACSTTAANTGLTSHGATDAMTGLDAASRQRLLRERQRWDQIPLASRLARLEHDLAALRQLPAATRAQLVATAEQLVRLDGRIMLDEWLYESLIRQRLQAAPGERFLPRTDGRSPAPDAQTALGIIDQWVKSAARSARTEAPASGVAELSGPALSPDGATLLQLDAQRSDPTAPPDGLSDDLPEMAPDRLPQLQAALQTLADLPPLRKPAVVQALAAICIEAPASGLAPGASAGVNPAVMRQRTAQERAPAPWRVALLQGLCVAIDCPCPWDRAQAEVA